MNGSLGSPGMGEGGVMASSSASSSSVAAPPTTACLLPHAPPLSEDAAIECEHMVEVFGDQVIRCLMDRNWATRVATPLPRGAHG